MTSNLKICHYIEDEDIYITPRGRLSFNAIAKKYRDPKAKADDQGKYAAEVSFPPIADLSLLKKAVNEAAQEKHGGKVDLWTPGKSKGIHNPFLKTEEFFSDLTSQFNSNGIKNPDGESLPVDLEGWLMIRTTSYKRRPVVKDKFGVLVDIDDMDVEIYSGRWCRLMVRPSGYEVNNNKGVTLYLEGIQLLSHDDKTSSGGGTTGEGFGAVDDEGDDDDAEI